MNKNIIIAALMFAAVPVVLTSCSKSPISRAVSLLEEVADILDNTTAENMVAMAEKLDKMEDEAKDINAALVKLDSSEKSLENVQKIMMAARKCDQSAKALSQRGNIVHVSTRRDGHGVQEERISSSEIVDKANKVVRLIMK